MSNDAYVGPDRRKPGHDVGTAVTPEIVNFAMLLGYDLRETTGLQALRDDVEFVQTWRTRTASVTKFLIWAGGALISGLLAGLAGALLAAGHFTAAVH